ncbi:MAG TPA: ASPIC/UnbV domain-containing protein, partial [Bryobacteraceae bacterium]|nr:ASPIC/UnbV domain-containing protein [Bryobacteraceae bacterium]
HAGLKYKEPPGVYRNVHGKFHTREVSVLPAVVGRGAAFGDLNNDGSIDAVVAVLGGSPLVILGKPNGQHWLTLKLNGTSSPRDGQGAAVRIGRQSAYASTSGSYLSASDSRVHFGLGGSTKASVEITWPGGKRQSLENVAADQILTVVEPE